MEKIINKLQDKTYRTSYVRSHIETGLSFQIRINRKARRLTQYDLADQINTPQPNISRLESCSHIPSIPTLLKLAEAFDCALLVKFVPFSRLIDETKDLSPEALTAASFIEDLGENTNKS